MPLILFSGFPSSGKSKWSHKLVEELERKISSLEPYQEGANFKVILHTDESLGIKHEMYRESNTEKSARATQMSAVKRDISKNNIVILDTMSYNKGFRYQLFCEAKSAYTSNCLIQVICPTNICFELNSKRKNDDKWDDDLLKQMIARFEEPDGTKRWDSPLISIAYDDEKLPFEEIWEIIALRKGPKPNLATVLKPAVGTNYLQELDRLTNQVVSDIVGYQQIDSFGTLKIKNFDGSECTVEVPSLQISTATLQRIKRSFVNLNRVRTINSVRIIPLFAEYLTNHLNSM
jgi:protein KTI12